MIIIKSQMLQYSCYIACKEKFTTVEHTAFSCVIENEKKKFLFKDSLYKPFSFLNWQKKCSGWHKLCSP